MDRSLTVKGRSQHRKRERKGRQDGAHRSHYISYKRGRCGSVQRLSPDADFVVVNDSQPPGDVNISKKEQGTPNRLPDSLLGGRMELQSDDAERALGRKADHIREIGIQRHEYAAVLNREAQNLFI
jgi:hypothetical protein